MEIAVVMEAVTQRRFLNDSTQFARCKQAMESADEARRAYEVARVGYRKALAGRGGAW